LLNKTAYPHFFIENQAAVYSIKLCGEACLHSRVVACRMFVLSPPFIQSHMADLSTFDVNSAGNPNNNIFGLPFSETDAQLVIVPVPMGGYGKLHSRHRPGFRAGVQSFFAGRHF